MQEQLTHVRGPAVRANGGIGVLVERRYLQQAQPAGLVRGLRALGHRVDVIDPEADVYAFDDGVRLDGLDLLIARGRSAAVLALLECAQRRGVTCINRRSAIEGVYDKAVMAAVLIEAGVPMPPTFLGPPARLAAHLPSEAYPLILKPVFGDNGRGLRVVAGAAELRTLAWPEPVALAQTYLAGGGFDLKLYGIGGEIRPVRRPAAFTPDGVSVTAAAEPVPASAELVALGRRCGELLGLELFGVDCVETAAGPVVIEVNDFPNYTGVPDADARLADHAAARRLAAVAA